MYFLTVKLWQSMSVFSRNGRLLKCFVKICNIELHENSTDIYSSMPCDRRTDSRLCSARKSFLISKGSYQSCTYVTGSSEWWRIKVRSIVADCITIFWHTVNSVIFPQSQFTLSLVTTPTGKVTVKFLCDKQENQLMLQDGVLDHRQQAVFHFDW